MMPLDARIKLPSRALKKLSASANDLSDKYRTSYEQQDLSCDVVLIANDGVRVLAHWIVICVWSVVFKEAFQSNLKEVDTGEIELEKFDGITLKLILDYMYTFPITLDSKTVESVLLAADFLQIDKLVNACCKFIVKNLRTSNCLSIHLFAEQHHYLPLRKMTYEFLYANFEEVSTKKEFLQLNEEQLVKFISDDCRHFRWEKDLFLSLVAWVEHDKQNRENLLLNLLNHIDFRRLPFAFIDMHRHLIPQTEYLDGWARWKKACLYGQDTSLVKVNDIKTRQTNNLVRVGENVFFEIQTFNSEFGIWFTEYWPNPFLSDSNLLAVVNKKVIVGNDSTSQYLDLETMRWNKCNKLSLLCEIWKYPSQIDANNKYNPPTKQIIYLPELPENSPLFTIKN